MYSMDSEPLYSYPSSSYEHITDLQLPPHNFDEPTDKSPLDEWAPPPPRITLTGNLDPTTGIFYHIPEPPRIRTVQACENCRTRKAKCSGGQPSCARCIGRGLVCEYTKDLRIRVRKPLGRTRDRSALHPSSSQEPPKERPSRKRRRNTILGEPLSSCVPLPLVFPAHLSASNSSKRLSLPASLDVGDMDIFSMNATGDSGSDLSDAYAGSGESSPRSSYSSYTGESIYATPLNSGLLDGFEPHRQDLDGRKPVPLESLPLESRYALEGIHDIDSALMHIDSALMHIDPALHSLGLTPELHPAPPLGVGMELLLAPHGLVPRSYPRPGSGSSSGSRSSYDGEGSSMRPNSAVEGGLSIFHQVQAHSVSPHSPHRQYHSPTPFETPGPSHSPHRQYHSPTPFETPGSTHFDSRQSSTHPPFDIFGQLDVHGMSGDLTASESQLYEAASPYVRAHDPAFFPHHQQESTPQPSSQPSLSNSVYSPWVAPSLNFPKPSRSLLRGWAAPPSTPLSSPVRHLKVAMPVPSRALSQRGVSGGLSVMIPETVSSNSLFSASDSVPSCAASPSLSPSVSNASSPLSSVPSMHEDMSEASPVPEKRARTGVETAPPIGRAASSSEVECVSTARAAESSTSGRRRGRTMSGALGI